MKLLYLTCALLASFAVIWAASGEEQQGSVKLPKQHSSRNQPGQGFKLISFDAVGKNIALGLDYLVPFLEVPVKRKRNAPPKPLVIVNSAAVVSCGLVVVGGVLVGHIIRSLGLEAITGDENRPIFGNSSILKPKSSEEDASYSTPAPIPANATSRKLDDESLSFPGFLDNFKLIYRNETGDRVATSLPNILGVVERTFLKNDVDLSMCLLKSICTLTYSAGQKVIKGGATDMEHLLDGATKWPWLMAWLEQSAFREAIEAGKVISSNHCTITYPTCKWTAPEEQILELLRNNVQFK
ncbi:uncharacterized protein LOC108148609 [Drosophila elegans]|uniref:uncharacterized protein LOC108148609 n=1 Tax=Drosophila elegans TaxID=30023 RepID=UPI0007E80792|nr:uncharacterized protein LOC108148609 [Drosophila elegans]